jgi:hypothetical protein
MADALKPGDMGDPTLSTVPDVFAGSMAAAMEDALHRLLSQDQMQTFDQNTNSSEARDRRRLLVAIAQGVVIHLADHIGALNVSFVDSTGQTITASVTISTDPSPLPPA